MEKKSFIILSVLTSIAVILRFYRIDENFIYHGEIGHNLLAIKNAYLNKQLPLIGPPTSHPWLYFGPFFYWLYSPILIISKFNPISHAYFGAFFSVLIVIANFIFAKYILNQRIAVISTLLIATSPLFLEFSRNARFFSIIAFLVYPFLYLLYKLSLGESRKFFLFGFIYGIMFSFHFTPLMLIPFIISVFIIQKTRITIMNISHILLGIFTSLITFVIYDLQNNLSMTKNIILWIPYRIAGFLGLYPKNTVSVKIVKENITSFKEYLSQSFIAYDNLIIQNLVLILFIGILIWFIYKFRLKQFKFNYLFIIIWVIWGYLAIFIHGSPPIHYFVPILPAAILIFSIAIELLSKHKKIKIVTYSLIIVIVLSNLSFYFSNNWFYKDNSKVTTDPYYLPYSLQLKAVKSISEDAKDKKYKLSRIGLDDHFEQDYAQNYIYLLWLEGNEPVKNANLEYLIVEPGSDKRYNINKGIIIHNDEIKVIKYNK